MNVLIADPQARTRLIVRTGLENAGFRICAEAMDGNDAVDKATALSPDVVVLDLRMPMLNGIEVASILRQRLPDTKIVLLSTYDVGESLVGACGIHATAAKTDGLANLVDCVRQVTRADSSQRNNPSASCRTQLSEEPPAGERTRSRLLGLSAPERPEPILFLSRNIGSNREESSC